MMRSPELVLFDLDGTLVDTAPDMAAALNDVMADEGHAALAFDTIRAHVSHGAAGLLRMAYGEATCENERERLRLALLDRYHRRLIDHSRLFPGMADLLTHIEDAGLLWGVVTNKPAWLTQPLLRAFNLSVRATTIVSGDTLAERKPDPAPLLHAAASAGTAVENALYVGDAERDVRAGRAAGMATCLARYGYLDTTDEPESWGADLIIDHPRELGPYLAKHSASAAAP